MAVRDPHLSLFNWLGYHYLRRCRHYFRAADVQTTCQELFGLKLDDRALDGPVYDVGGSSNLDLQPMQLTTSCVVCKSLSFDVAPHRSICQ